MGHVNLLVLAPVCGDAFAQKNKLFLGLCWATWGVCAALQKIRSVGWLHVGLMLAPYLSPCWVISRLCSAYLGSYTSIFGHLEDYIGILEG